MIDALSTLLGSETLATAVVSAIDVLIVAYVIYRILLVIKGTRAIQMLIGLMLVIVVFFASKEEYLDLATLNWVLDKFISYFIVIVVVIFQSDIRRGLAQVGRSPVFAGLSHGCVRSYCWQTKSSDICGSSCTRQLQGFQSRWSGSS